MESMHETFCFMRLGQYCKRASVDHLFDPNLFESQLRRQVSILIEKDTTAWRTEYVCKPSFFIRSRDSILYPDHRELAALEADFIRNGIGSEGVWDPSWQWAEYPNEWAVSKKWWQGDIAVKNLLFVEAISGS